MNKKIGLLIVSLVTSFAMSTVSFAKTETDNEKINVPVAQSENYITIVRASGEVEVYPLDEEFLRVCTVSSDEVTEIDDVLMCSPSSVVQPLTSVYTYNWTIQQGYIGYSTLTFNLKEGDWISYVIVAGGDASVGLYANDEKEFMAARHYIGYNGESEADSFTTKKDLYNVSFAIDNIGSRTNTYQGSYTVP